MICNAFGSCPDPVSEKILEIFFSFLPVVLLLIIFTIFFLLFSEWIRPHLNLEKQRGCFDIIFPEEPGEKEEQEDND